MHVGSRTSTQSRSHAQKYFKKMGINIDKPELSMNLYAGALSLTKLEINDADLDIESEIKIWIEFWNTPHPKLRESTMMFSDQANTLSKTKEENKDDPKSKSDKGADLFQMPDKDDTQRVRASSEKSINQEKLINHKAKPKKRVRVPKATKVTKAVKVPCKYFISWLLIGKSKKLQKDEKALKDGKSFDNTNASVQNNENEQIPCDKEALAENVTQTKFDIPKQTVNFGDVFIEHGFGFGNDESFDSSNIIKPEMRDNESVKDDLIEIGIDIMDKDIDFDMDWSEPISIMEQNSKELQLQDVNNQEFDLKELQDNDEDFSHHSGLLMNDFSSGHQFYV
jgi:hypothetical protein